MALPAQSSYDVARQARGTSVTDSPEQLCQPREDSPSPDRGQPHDASHEVRDWETTHEASSLRPASLALIAVRSRAHAAQQVCWHEDLGESILAPLACDEAGCGGSGEVLGTHSEPEREDSPDWSEDGERQDAPPNSGREMLLHRQQVEEGRGLGRQQRRSQHVSDHRGLQQCQQQPPTSQPTTSQQHETHLQQQQQQQLEQQLQLHMQLQLQLQLQLGQLQLQEQLGQQLRSQQQSNRRREQRHEDLSQLRQPDDASCHGGGKCTADCSSHSVEGPCPPARCAPATGSAPPTQPSAAAAHDSAEAPDRYHQHLYKTKLCVLWQEGCCHRRICRFAHGEQELQEPPDFSKTAMCRHAKRGWCQSANCRFAHNMDELRVSNGFFKTRICRYHASGTCRRGDDCFFAHSECEIRPPFKEALVGRDDSAHADAQTCSSSTPLDKNDRGPVAEAMPQMSCGDGAQYTHHHQMQWPPGPAGHQDAPRNLCQVQQHQHDWFLQQQQQQQQSLQRHQVPQQQALQQLPRQLPRQLPQQLPLQQQQQPPLPQQEQLHWQPAFRPVQMQELSCPRSTSLQSTADVGAPHWERRSSDSSTSWERGDSAASDVPPSASSTQPWRSLHPWAQEPGGPMCAHGPPAPLVLLGAQGSAMPQPMPQGAATADPPPVRGPAAPEAARAAPQEGAAGLQAIASFMSQMKVGMLLAAMPEQYED